MLKARGCSSQVFCLTVLVCSLGFSTTRAQDEMLADIQYKEDYDRIQEIMKVSQPVQRTTKFLQLFEDRGDMNRQLRDYVDNIFAQDLESLMRQDNYKALDKICSRAIEVRPKFGEAYFFYAVALRRDKKMNEAMDAFAKCYVIMNPFQKKAKQLLDVTYRDMNKGSLIGEDKIVERARKELK